METKRYKVKLVWKLKKIQTKIEKSQKVDFEIETKDFVKIPQLLLEYKDVLQNYLKRGIVEIIVNKNIVCISLLAPKRGYYKERRYK